MKYFDMSKRSFNLLIAAAGSVATTKIPVLIKCLSDISADKNPYCFEIRLLVTRCAKHFFKMSDLPKDVKVFDDEVEWSWRQKGDPVWHVELVNISDMMVIAPLNANTMSKIANGMCDNILTSTIRSWDFKKPLVFCPAMSVNMWAHPITWKHINTLQQWGFIHVPPISKTLACKSVGVGAMAEIHTIIQVILWIVDCKQKS